MCLARRRLQMGGRDGFSDRPVLELDEDLLPPEMPGLVREGIVSSLLEQLDCVRCCAIGSPAVSEDRGGLMTRPCGNPTSTLNTLDELSPYDPAADELLYRVFADYGLVISGR